MTSLLTSLARSVAAADLPVRVVTGGTQHYDNTFYDGGLTTYASTNVTITANRLYAVPLVLPAGTYDRLGFHLGTSAAAGKLARTGLYRPTAAGLPGTLFLDAASDYAADGASAYALQTVSFTLSQPTLLFGAFWSDGAPVIGGWTVPGRNWFGHLINSAAKIGMCYAAGTYGSFPSSFGAPAGYAASSVIRIMARAA